MEIAGIVLGSVGLVGPALSAFRRCIQPLSNYSRVDNQLAKISRSISIQQYIYKESWALGLSLIKIEESIATVMLEDEDYPILKKILSSTMDEETIKQYSFKPFATENIQTQSSGMSSRIEALKATISTDMTTNPVVWSFRRKKQLEILVQELRTKNNDLKNLLDQKKATEEIRKEEPSAPLKHKLAQLLAFRERSMMFSKSLTAMPPCLCHCINLQLQSDISGTPKPISDQKLSASISQNNNVIPAIIETIRYLLIVTNRDDNIDNPQPAKKSTGRYFTITSELKPEESEKQMLLLKNPMAEWVKKDELLQKRIWFADNQVIETSSPWAIVIGPAGTGAGEVVVLDLRREPAVPVPGAMPDASALPISNPEMRVDSLCSLMGQHAPRSSTNNFLGRLKSYNPTCRYSIYTNQADDSEITIKSLPTILNQLLPDDRFRISFVLAQSLLQLGSYSGSFFPKQWRSHDILFFERNNFRSMVDPIGVPHILIPTPTKLHRGVETVDTRARGDSKHLESPARSEHLFSLSLTLIEIGFGKPFYQIVSESKNFQRKEMQLEGPFAEFMIAKDILKSGLLDRNLSTKFAQIVKRCLYCDFGIDDDDFYKHELQEVFYHKVVAPLEDCLVEFVKKK
ncbi:unnamed protein product [Tuber aestivum]|uniref:DUF7580 domain-containing protein n=1 Tax=Tuber aestivum TaxID=59557 RepID=A0A292PWV5_9PEZI|nr:unnamed protein product [Tuber aestivum]